MQAVLEVRLLSDEVYRNPRKTRFSKKQEGNGSRPLWGIKSQRLHFWSTPPYIATLRFDSGRNGGDSVRTRARRAHLHVG